MGTDKASLSETEKMDLVKESCKVAYADEFIEDLPNVCASSNLRDRLLTHILGVLYPNWRASHYPLRRSEAKTSNSTEHHLRPADSPSGRSNKRTRPEGRTRRTASAG